MKFRTGSSNCEMGGNEVENMRHKIMAVFMLNAKEIIVNMSMLTSLLLPVVMSLMFQRMDTTGAPMPFIVINVIIGITFASTLGAILMGLVAEENEHGTMEHMIVDRQDMAANFLGKALLLFPAAFLILGINLIVLGYMNLLSITIFPALVLIWLFFFFSSAGFGMLSNSVAATSLFIMILLFVFAMSPYIDFLIYDRTNVIRQFFELTPVYQIKHIEGGSLAGPYISLILWAVLSLVFFMTVFNRRAKSL